MKKKTLLSWSSGKDSAWSLHVLRQHSGIEVVGLFSVLDRQLNRVPMHATRVELLNRQAQAAELPLHRIELPGLCSKRESDNIMGEFIQQCLADEIDCIAFGDLFLDDVREYRESQMSGTGIELLFPLWQAPTDILARQMLTANLEAYISSVDLSKLPKSFVGRQWSLELLNELPADVDPCGEYGEFHTIVVNGPMLHEPIDIKIGSITENDRFAYADIMPVSR